MTLKLVTFFDGLPHAGTVPTTLHLFFSPQTNPLRQECCRVSIKDVATGSKRWRDFLRVVELGCEGTPYTQVSPAAIFAAFVGV